MHVQQMRKIIFIAILHRIELFLKTRYTIEIDIITSRKRMEKAGRTRILLRRTRRQQNQRNGKYPQTSLPKQQLTNKSAFHL